MRRTCTNCEKEHRCPGADFGDSNCSEWEKRKHLTIPEYLRRRVEEDAVDELEKSALEKDRMRDALEEIAERRGRW